jgi:predicted dehydrogenase
MPEPLTALLFGAGSRGAQAYGPYALANPDQIKFVAVAEPNPVRQERFASEHAIPADRRFESWEDALAIDQMADVVINCTQDQTHAESSIAALQSGYDMLLEKPIANTLVDSFRIVQTAEQQERYLQICHVLRYTDFFQKIKNILGEGKLGQISTISHRENVSSWHMTHSFVRGNWRQLELSSPMILAKCCHDLDLLVWFTGEPAINLSSYGSLRHFRPENAPPGAPGRCTDGCPVESTCPFYAPSIYIELTPFKFAHSQTANPIYRLVGNQSLKNPALTNALSRIVPKLRELTEYQGWPRSVICDDPSDEEALLKALKEGPYGRCVYHCDNDVVDHQVVAMEFESGITATLTMHGHSHEEGRTLRIDGSKASLLAKFSINGSYIEIHDHRSMRTEVIEFPYHVEQVGHGGGDFGIMRDFVHNMNSEPRPTTSARESLESHLMAFAAEDSRYHQKQIQMSDFRREAETQASLKENG